jgi:hypothetical protein
VEKRHTNDEDVSQPGRDDFHDAPLSARTSVREYGFYCTQAQHALKPPILRLAHLRDRQFWRCTEPESVLIMLMEQFRKGLERIGESIPNVEARTEVIRMRTSAIHSISNRPFRVVRTDLYGDR